MEKDPTPFPMQEDVHTQATPHPLGENMAMARRAPPLGGPGQRGGRSGRERGDPPPGRDGAAGARVAARLPCQRRRRLIAQFGETFLHMG